MEDIVGKAVAGVLFLSFLAVTVFLDVRRRQRITAGLSESIGSTRCVACDGELVERHPEAWACTACGYEQGPGWERRRQAVHLERLMALSPEEARTRAHQLLRDARLALLSATAPLRMPTVVEGSGKNARTVLNPDVLDAAQDITQCWQNLQEAGLIDQEVGASLAEAGFDSSMPMPSCDDLYELAHAPRAAAELLPMVSTASRQVAKAMKALAIEA